MVNYQQAKIYKITTLQTDKIYIGSTCKKYLSSRLGEHKNQLNKYKNGKCNYTSSFELLDKYNDCEIILIENFPCNNKDELHAKERYYTELYKDICINKYVPNRSIKEWRSDNAEEIKNYMKEYRINNKDKIKEYCKFTIKCECGIEFRRDNKSRHLKSNYHLRYLKSKQINESKKLNENNNEIKNENEN